MAPFFPHKMERDQPSFQWICPNSNGRSKQRSKFLQTPTTTKHVIQNATACLSRYKTRMVHAHRLVVCQKMRVIRYNCRSHVPRPSQKMVCLGHLFLEKLVPRPPSYAQQRLTQLLRPRNASHRAPYSCLAQTEFGGPSDGSGVWTN